jgi:hypothetical protein
MGLAVIINRMQYERGAVCEGFVVPTTVPRTPSELPQSAEDHCTRLMSEPIRRPDHPNAHELKLFGSQ